MEITETNVKSILTRTTGFLETVTSHSLQPYRGCSYGNSLCGVGCYVQHSYWVTKGRLWGSFLEVRTNAAEAYRRQYERERKWAREKRDGFSIFMSSATDPFVPQEQKYRISESVFTAMSEQVPDALILQTHSHRVVDYLDVLSTIDCDLRVHLSIETDRESIDGLPRHASSVSDRFESAARLKAAGVNVVITVAPLLPIEDPESFFERISECASSVVIDHFIEGDGSSGGSRTLKTRLPEAIESIEPDAVDLSYRDRMVEVAEAIMPGRVGVNIDGFSGRYSKRG